MKRPAKRIQVILPTTGKILVNSENKYYKLMDTLIRFGYSSPTLKVNTDCLNTGQKIGIVWGSREMALGVTKRYILECQDVPYFNNSISDIKEYKLSQIFTKLK
jgi:hypothetical protein